MLHALGLWLGASHIADPEHADHALGCRCRCSANGRAQTLASDPLNSLLMSLTAAEIRARKISTLGEMRPAAARLLGYVYAARADLFPATKWPASRPRPLLAPAAAGRSPRNSP